MQMGCPQIMLYRFDECVLDINRRELRRGGTLVALEPQVFDLLAFLIGNRDRVISKTELIDAIWKGRIVSDATVDSRIGAARRAVGDTGHEQRFVRTMIGKGVRFVGEAREEMPSPGPSALLDAAALSIVVLPFINQSGDDEQDYFADGITDDLTTDLSRIANSFVIARTTAFTYKGKAVDVKQLGRDLGVRYVIEGGVRRADQQVQVHVQLIDAETGAHLWAHRFSTDRRSLAETQDDIVLRLARALQVQVMEAGARRSLRDKPNDLDADDCVMRGWAWYYRVRSQATLAEAQRAFEQALRTDLSSVAAKVGLATVLTDYVGVGLDHVSDGIRITPDEDLARSERLLVEAVEINPDHHMARAAMGRLRRLQNRLTDARIELEKAVELDPNNAFATLHLGITLLHLTRLVDARRCFERVLLLAPLDPSSVFYYFWLGYCHLLLGNLDTSIDFLRKSRSANSQSPGTHLILAAALGLKGEISEAKATLRDYHILKPEMRTLAQMRDANPNWTVTPEYTTLREQTVGLGLRRTGLPED